MLSRFRNSLIFAPKQENKINLNDTLKPLCILLSIVGLFPYNLKFRNQSFVIINKSVYLNLLCAVSFCLVLCSSAFMHLQHIYITHESNPMMDVFMTQINYIFEMFTLILFCIVAYVCTFLNRSKFVNILNKFAKWTDGQHSGSYKILNAIQPKVRTVMISITCLYIIEIMINGTRADTPWKITLCHFSLDLPQTLQFLSIGFYYVLVCMLGAIISSITDHVKALTKKQPVSHCYMNVDCKASLTLKQLEATYIEVYEVKQGIIKIFQASILVTTVQSFHGIVSEMHRVYHGLVQNTFSLHETVNCSIWCLYQIMKIYILSNCGNHLKDKILKLGQALYNIPTQKHDMKLLAEIQHFSTLMNYYGGDLTVYGLFSIDSTLVFKVVASAIMYFIVLVQLDEKKITP
ncbi:uncharacterized protein LOC115440066 [Manduca sexta]|uniref:uncharacterized protein LOC115440066 n=1 Tax=Manduca sexta TaxID=7130 RepID=UPI001184313B|nr:uncharacterized protein LOC115440066 [Manduca sexta]